jgi:hypothetical protein
MPPGKKRTAGSSGGFSLQTSKWRTIGSATSRRPVEKAGKEYKEMKAWQIHRESLNGLTAILSIVRFL